VTNDPGSVDDGQSFVTMALVAGNPGRTPIDHSTLDDCPQIAFANPCSPGNCTDPATTLEWGFWPGCCAQKSVDCKYAECQTLEDGSHWMPVLQIYYSTAFPIGNSAKQFTVNGTLIGPLPTTP
jgi:hypothetical protein